MPALSCVMTEDTYIAGMYRYAGIGSPGGLDRYIWMQAWLYPLRWNLVKFRLYLI